MSGRDPDIKSVFEVSDDSLQGILGYHLYTTAMKYNITEKEIWDFLPPDVIPHTFSWVRYYDKQELTHEMGCNFEAYQSRVSLVLIVGVFEASLQDFIRQLCNKGYRQNLESPPNLEILNPERTSNKKLIKWAYQQAKKCGIGDFSSLLRLHTTFGKIDNARRLRHLIVHNKGLFNINYEKDAIREDSISVELHPSYREFNNGPNLRIPLALNSSYVVDFSRAHIEALHVLHNSLQRRYFGCQDAYSYKEERKKIEWSRILRGI